MSGYPTDCSCNANDSLCGAGAVVGTFSCKSEVGPDRCVCNKGANQIVCAPGQRCLADDTCG